MDECTIAWVCKVWNNATTRKELIKLADVFQGAGMAVYGFDPQAGSDYWTLSDLAFIKAMGVGYDD